jgi:hypothetical protein
MKENKIKIVCDVYGNSFGSLKRETNWRLKKKKSEEKKGQTSVKRAQERNCDI